jgi:IS5 family transposase
LILDLVIEAGNPADSERFLPMLNRHIGFYGEAPRQTAADGGFASRHNLGEAKALGVRDVAFHKKAGLRVMDMVKSNWVYRKLRNFRAGIESDISCLKRAVIDDPKAPPAARIGAATTVLDRGWGWPTQSIEGNVKPFSLDLVALSMVDREAKARALTEGKLIEGEAKEAER